MTQNRRHFIKQLSTGALAAAAVPYLYSCSDKEIKLTILHTNDVHSQIEPLAANHPKFPNGGGFAKRAHLIQQIRQKNEHVLLFDSGDIFQGTPYFNFYKGKLEIELMNKMQYDAATIGNHEFDNGINELANQVKKAQFPFISSNYVFNNTPMQEQTIPYKIFQMGPVKVGVIGLGIQLEGLVNPDFYGNTQYLDPLQKANETAQLLKKEDCDYIICLSHLGYKHDNGKVSDIDIAKNSSHIDLILGGHTHTFMKEPDHITNLKGKDVLINQMGWGGIFLGRLDITFTNHSQPVVLNTVYHV